MDIQKYLYQGSLIWTLTSNGYKYLTLNLVRSIEALKVPWRLLVVCADKESYTFFKRECVACMLYKKAESSPETRPAQWGSKLFQKSNFIKLDLLHDFSIHPAISNCIFLDGDIVVFKNFLPDILSRLDETGLLFQCDSREIDPCSSPCQNCCTGLIAFRKGSANELFAASAASNLDLWKEIHDDQVWVNKHLAKGSWQYETLPRHFYPNGVFVGKKELISEAFLLHFNYRIGTQKIADMRALGYWKLPY